METTPEPQEAETVDQDGSLRPVRFLNEKLMKLISARAEDEIPVMEVFKTVEGEGAHIGTPRVLARVGGCAIKCSWCDTRHSWHPTAQADVMNVQALLDLILETAADNVQQVSITGGEPMHYPRQLLWLVPQLRRRLYNVSLETSGIIMNNEVFSLFDYVSMDVKTPSSGVPISSRLLGRYQELYNWHPRIQFKVVITDERDLQWVSDNLRFLYDANPVARHPLIMTPGAMSTLNELKSGSLAQHLLDIINMIGEWNKRANIRVICQQHQLLSYR